MVTVRVLASDGVALAAHRSGGGQPLYAIHGGPATDHGCFGAYLQPIAGYRELYLLDQRGCGDSDDAPASSYALERLAQDIEETRAHLNHPQTDLLGYSFGCSIALRFALRWPASVRTLVLVDGMVRGWRGIVASPRAWPLWARALFTGGRSDTDSSEFHLRYEVANAEAMDEVRALLASHGRFDPARVRPLSSAAAHALDPRPLLEAGMPVLAIYGKQDRRFTADVGFLRALGARVALIDGAGHFPFVEQHQTFHAILKDFLESDAARSADGAR